MVSTSVTAQGKCESVQSELSHMFGTYSDRAKLALIMASWLFVPRTHDDNYLGPGIDPYDAYVPNLKHWYSFQIVYPFALFLIKMSFLTLYNRLFTPPIINRYLLYGTGIFIIVYTIVIMFVFVCITLLYMLQSAEIQWDWHEARLLNAPARPMQCCLAFLPQEIALTWRRFTSRHQLSIS